MRVHGYKSNTEPWRYGDKVEGIVAQYLDLRYRMLPYIYSQNAEIFLLGFYFDASASDGFFPNDRKALEQNHQFMFGPSLLVAPVTKANVSKWNTYLPDYAAGWIDFSAWREIPRRTKC